MGSGHDIPAPWRDGLKFKLNHVTQQGPHLKGLDLSNITNKKMELFSTD
jgi:hypothetical protein